MATTTPERKLPNGPVSELTTSLLKYPPWVDLRERNQSGIIAFNVYARDVSDFNDIQAEDAKQAPVLSKADAANVPNAADQARVGANNGLTRKDAAALTAAHLGYTITDAIMQATDGSLLRKGAELTFGEGAVKATTKVAGTGLTSASIALVGSAMGLTDKRSYRAHIYLPMQNLSTTYAQGWSETDMESKNIASFANAVGKDIGQLKTEGDWSKFMDSIKGTGRGAVNYALHYALNAGSDKEAAALAKEATGTISNPHKTLIYSGPGGGEGTGMRTFSFKFNLIPTTPQEAITIQKIITTFKKYSSPSLHKTQLIFGYPAEFHIKFLNFDSNGVLKENPNLPKLAPCVVTKVTVDYSGGENTDTMFMLRATPETNNMPTPGFILLTIDLKETAVLTAEDVGPLSSDESGASYGGY